MRDRLSHARESRGGVPALARGMGSCAALLRLNGAPVLVRTRRAMAHHLLAPRSGPPAGDFPISVGALTLGSGATADVMVARDGAVDALCPVELQSDGGLAVTALGERGFPHGGGKISSLESQARPLSLDLGLHREGYQPSVDPHLRKQRLGPPKSKPSQGRLAQLDRALASGAKGHRFESCIAHRVSTSCFKALDEVTTVAPGAISGACDRIVPSSPTATASTGASGAAIPNAWPIPSRRSSTARCALFDVRAECESQAMCGGWRACCHASALCLTVQ